MTATLGYYINTRLDGKQYLQVDKNIAETNIKDKILTAKNINVPS